MGDKIQIALESPRYNNDGSASIDARVSKMPARGFEGEMLTVERYPMQVHIRVTDSEGHHGGLYLGMATARKLLAALTDAVLQDH